MFSLHENFYEPLAHRPILLTHCIVYKAIFTSPTKNLVALGIGLVSFCEDCMLLNAYNTRDALYQFNSIQFNSNPLFLEGNPISNAFLPRGLLTYIQYINIMSYQLNMSMNSDNVTK